MTTTTEALAVPVPVPVPVAPTPADMTKLAHMLGVSKDKPKRTWGYRNYYAASASAVPAMERLVAAGYCTRGSQYGEGGFNYHATTEGCVAAGLDKAGIKRAFED